MALLKLEGEMSSKRHKIIKNSIKGGHQMKITDLEAYYSLLNTFWERGYSIGDEDEMPELDDYEYLKCKRESTAGYVYLFNKNIIKLENIPEKYLTRKFFLHVNNLKDVEKYINSHRKKFNKRFYKNRIETVDYVHKEDFEVIPLDLIDEELAMCAMLKSIREDFISSIDWFYTVAKRKPEVLSKELYILAAACLQKECDVKKIIDILPKEYLTSEFYFAICLGKGKDMLKCVPKEFLTTEFLIKMLNFDMNKIGDFSEEILEREVANPEDSIPKLQIETIIKDIKQKGISLKKLKIWQIAIIIKGDLIKEIDLNEERIKFFLSIYDKDSLEYEYGLKRNYKEYLRETDPSKCIPIRARNDAKMSGMIALSSLMSGKDIESAITDGNDVMNMLTDHKTLLPIKYAYSVPEKYCKKYDKEEYLLEIYKKLGIKVIEEISPYYYNVILPNNYCIDEDGYGCTLKDQNGKSLIHYYDRGPFYDRSVKVDKIFVTL